jgi:FADH2 O2-dependent halogenase
LLGVLRLAEVLAKSPAGVWNEAELAGYEHRTLGEIDAVQQLVETLYLNMERFEVFVAASLLYFAAAIYSETAHRLGEPKRARGFLLRDDPAFGPAAAAALEYARQRHPDWSPHEATTRLLEAIKPINLASLGEPRFGNWYPVTAADISRGDERFRRHAEGQLQQPT